MEWMLGTEKPIQLRELPQFQVKDIRAGNSEAVLGGVFDHLTGVREGRSWLYISAEDLLLGDLEALAPKQHSVSFRVAIGEAHEHAPVGAILPWIDGYWITSLVALILGPSSSWQRTEFISSDAIVTKRNGVRQWRKAKSGEVILEDASLRAGEWDRTLRNLPDEDRGGR